MTPTVKLVMILIGLAYLISPADLIPDLLLPWIGWIDDGLVLWTIYYLLRYGELPWFLFKKKASTRARASHRHPKSAPGATEPRIPAGKRHQNPGNQTKRKRRPAEIRENRPVIPTKSSESNRMRTGMKSRRPTRPRSSSTIRTSSPTWAKNSQPWPMRNSWKFRLPTGISNRTKADDDRHTDH